MTIIVQILLTFVMSHVSVIAKQTNVIIAKIEGSLNKALNEKAAPIFHDVFEVGFGAIKKKMLKLILKMEKIEAPLKKVEEMKNLKGSIGNKLGAIGDKLGGGIIGSAADKVDKAIIKEAVSKKFGKIGEKIGSIKESVGNFGATTDEVDTAITEEEASSSEPEPEPEPIISIKEGDEFFYSPWGGRCIASYGNGVLLMNRAGSNSTGIKTWECKDADETKKLLCGSTVGVEWDNKGNYLSMTATDNDTLKVMHGSEAYYFKRMMPLESGSAFNYSPWGGKCLVSYDSSGKLYVAREGVSRDATAYAFSMKNAHDTDKLRAGYGVMVNWDNLNTYTIKITMTNPNTLAALHGTQTYNFTKM